MLTSKLLSLYLRLLCKNANMTKCHFVKITNRLVSFSIQVSLDQKYLLYFSMLEINWVISRGFAK